MERLVKIPQLGFAEAVKLVLGHMSDFKGRSRRSEFWWFMLAFYILKVVVEQLLTLSGLLLVTCIFDIFVMYLAFAVTVRRLHDTGRSAWWVVVSWASSAFYSFYAIATGLLERFQSVNVTPDDAMALLTDPVLIVCAIVSLASGIPTIVFCCLDSVPGENRYGRSPKWTTAEEAFGGAKASDGVAE